MRHIHTYKFKHVVVDNILKQKYYIYACIECDRIHVFKSRVQDL